MLQLTINGNNSYQQPQNGDTGPAFFPAMASNIAFMNAHVHDGVKGQFNPVVTQSIASGSWVAAPIGGGLYRQLVTMPAGMAYANFQIQMRSSAGHLLDLTIEEVSSSTYYVYINDNSQTITAVYSS